MKLKSKGRKALTAAKLDASKACDRMEWCFLDPIMEEMGFHDKWRSWVWECVSSVQFSLFVDGVTWVDFKLST